MTGKHYFRTEQAANDHTTIHYFEFMGELCTRQIEIRRGRWRFAWQSPDLRNPAIDDRALSTRAFKPTDCITRQQFDDAWATAQLRGRQNITPNTSWEQAAAYSRAVRVGNTVVVAGTTAVDEQGAVIGEGDAHAQATAILRKIEQALHRVGAAPEDIVRTRIYVTDATLWPEIARAYRTFFDDIRPVATLVEVQSLIEPELLVAIEADAIITSAD